MRLIGQSKLAFLAVMLNIAAIPLDAAPQAASQDRIRGRIDAARTRRLSGQIHRLSQAAADEGPINPAAVMSDILIAFKPSPAQQSELDVLLAEQQNPSSTSFHQWLTPAEFGNRFGLSASDELKVTAWLSSQGLTPARHARGRNWMAFSGTASAVSKALHTPIHRFRVNGEEHFANTAEPAVPDALADVVAGFAGLHDFRLASHAKLGQRLDPKDTSRSGAHYLAPEDWSTIYNVSPLVQAGFDGTGIGIAVVGQSDILLSDLRSFRTQFGLPTNDPKIVLYSGIDPGYNGAQVEANLDLEWAGAIAPKAQLYYVTGPDAFAAALYAVDNNIAPVLSISFGGCESFNQDIAPVFRAMAQQANAQGITIAASSGDAGASCDPQNGIPYAVHGMATSIPASLPEVTSVGGTQFNEGSGTFWKTTNSTALGSALSYIPELAWNETSVANGLAAGAGGLSSLFPKPGWQQAPGVPADNRRGVPDVALAAAAGHDSYLFVYQGGFYRVGGTSASTPTFAAVIALLNHYQLKKGFLPKAGLGNINPQLYRMFRVAPAAFHDVTGGDNIVPCLLGSADCLAGSFGSAAGPGYDLATGLGSIDANNLVTLWNTAVASPTVTLALDKTQVDVNGTVVATATVSAATGTPTGAVNFSFSGTILGSVPLQPNAARSTASLTFPAWLAGGIGSGTVTALYSGDASFGSAGATASLRITAPSGASAVVFTGPAVVYPGNPDAQGLTWQAELTLKELGGYPSLITGFTIDGKPQPLPQYIPTNNLTANGSIAISIELHNLSGTETHMYAVTGLDSAGINWTRQHQVTFSPALTDADFEISATPPIVTETNRFPGCAFSAQISITDEAGFDGTISSLAAGSVNLSRQIAAVFGTAQLGAFGTLTGTVCIDQALTLGSETISVSLLYNPFGVVVSHEVTVTLAPPPALSIKLTPSPGSVAFVASKTSRPITQSLSLDLSDPTQPWSLTVLPNNQTGGWLSVSQTSGRGPATILLTASGARYGPGVYRALLIFHSPNATPQSVTVPVIFTLNGNPAAMAITGVANAASFITTVSPGSLVAVTGSGLSSYTGSVPATSGALPATYKGVSATVNGYPAPLQYLSPSQINLQIPYEAGAGPAVLGINNNGSVAGYLFNIVPAAPGVFADTQGNLVPNAAVTQGIAATLYMTGAGDMSPTLTTGNSPAISTPVSGLPRPLLPVSVTVAGIPVFVAFAGNPVTLVGVTQINFVVPNWVPAGMQPLVVTSNGVSSKPVNIQVIAAK